MEIFPSFNFFFEKLFKKFRNNNAVFLRFLNFNNLFPSNPNHQRRNLRLECFFFVFERNNEIKCRPIELNGVDLSKIFSKLWNIPKDILFPSFMNNGFE